MTGDQMQALVAHTNIKAEKIRVLFRAGVPRGDIARFLDISYQHVQNVLKRSALLGRGTHPDQVDTSKASDAELVELQSRRLVALPERFVQAMGLAEGDSLVCSLEDGCLKLMSRTQAARVLLASARNHMPGEANLLSALLAAEERPRSR